MAAFDGLLLLRALQEKVIARYVLAVLRFDSCRIVQRRLAQSLVENLPILAAMDELSGQEAGYVEEDAKAAQKQSSQSVDSLLKALRNSVGRSIMLRDSMMAVLL
jgi:transcription initiation factor TFIID subunit 2